MTMNEDWTKEWESRIVNGVYPLRRFLGRSNHSVVFLTECKAQNVAQAAIKILPADPALTEAQLAHWRSAATLSHPHLIRLLDADRCQLGGHNFLFVVMEYAEQNLAQILPGRALTPDEVRDLLPATLDALAYLHGRNLLQGGLKPPNFLVVDDRLKLASDTIRPADERIASTAKPSLYDPPEAKNGGMSTAGDMWGLGITLVEALTQTPPAWSRERSESVSLPANLAPEFVDTIQRCLNRDPGHRPAIAALVAQFKPAPSATPASAAPPAMNEPLVPTRPPATPSTAPPAMNEPLVPTRSPATPSTAPPTMNEPLVRTRPPATPSTAPPTMNEPLVRTPSTRNSPKTRFLVMVITVITVGIITLWAVWTGVHLFHTHANVQQSASIIPQSPPAVSQPAVSPPAAVENPKASIAAAPLPTVLHQEIPDPSRSARESIRGVIKIAVRVIVDRSGNVVAATLDNRGSSKYFARVAMDAAWKWQFAQAKDKASRVWLLHFAFTRAGTTAHAAELR
jgi:serine/threonine protein kinase